MSYEITKEHLLDMATGASILGTGGGGDPLLGRLLVENALANGGRVRVISLDELHDDDLVMTAALMGAPSVVLEKLPNGTEAASAVRALENHLGRKATAIIPMECGGVNSMLPLLVAAVTGLPVVDADGMGRAFPELQMETFSVYGVNATPMAVADERGDTAIVSTGTDNKRSEDLARALTIRMGGASYISNYPMSGADAKRTAIGGTLSLTRIIGAAIRGASDRHESPFDSLRTALVDTPYSFSKVLYTGKVVDVERGVIEGFTAGRVVIEALPDEPQLVVDFRNEYVKATIGGEIAAVVPDLICLLDTDTGLAVGSDRLRYGMRVTAFGISAPRIMTTPLALQTFGPREFGLDCDWTALEELQSA